MEMNSALVEIQFKAETKKKVLELKRPPYLPIVCVSPKKCRFTSIPAPYKVYNTRSDRSKVGLYPANNEVYKLSFRKP